jgi:predicted transcriptional regulator
MKKLLIIVLLTLSMVACSNQNNYTSEEKNFEDVQRKFPNALEKLEKDTGNFAEIQETYPNAIEMLTEDNEKEAKELEKKVLEDMKTNPDKVQFADQLIW